MEQFSASVADFDYFSGYFQFFMKTFIEAVFARSTFWNSMNIR